MKAKKIYSAFFALKNAYENLYNYIKETKKYIIVEQELKNLIDNFEKILTLYKVLQSTATPADLEGDDRLNFKVSKNQTLKEYLKERRLNETNPQMRRDFFVYFEITYEYSLKTREVEILDEKYLKSYEL